MLVRKVLFLRSDRHSACFWRCASCRCRPQLKQTRCRPGDGATKQSIIDFVGRVTKSGSADFVPEAHRVAVFDNDGTLWAEQPIYFQLAFALDTTKAIAPSHPEWMTLTS